jgi:hypothetical protein
VTNTRTATGVALQSSSLIPGGGDWFDMIGSLPITKSLLQQSQGPPLCGYNKELRLFADITPSGELDPLYAFSNACREELKLV